jgi:hypothetical protein
MVRLLEMRLTVVWTKGMSAEPRTLMPRPRGGKAGCYRGVISRFVEPLVVPLDMHVRPASAGLAPGHQPRLLATRV